MDPTRMTLIGAGAGFLAAVLIVGSFAMIAVNNYDGDDDSGLVKTSQSMPAAQEAFAKGLKDEDAAYLKERFEMIMTISGTGDVPMGEALMRLDPDAGDHEFKMILELAAMAEAYGFNETTESEAQEDEFTEDGLFGDAFGAESMERFEMYFVKSGTEQAMGFGGMNWAWRDHDASDDDFTLFPEEEPDEFSEDPRDSQPPMAMEELEQFIEADDNISAHEIEASEWEGTPTWRITSTLHDEEMQGDAVMHFRQADMAPLAFDITMEVLPEDGFNALVTEQDPSMDLSALEDFEMYMSIRFEYGGDFEIELPADATRLAVSVETDDEQDESQMYRRVNGDHEDVVPLDELQVHVVVLDEAAMMENPFGGPVVSETLASLDLDQAHEITQGDYTIEYQDNDGDGFLSSGDRFLVRSENGDGIWSNETHKVALLIYDEWAGDYEGAPGPALVWILGLFAATGIALRRKRKNAE